jgi:nucleotide-binding universal stress UspA family protein
MSSKKMLFGDDGSMPADAAWLWVNCHDWPDWTIDVLRAVEAQAAPVPDRQLLRPEMAEDLRTMTVREDPRYALHTRGSDYDLIVIGSKGRGLMKSLHIGSTAEWLMHLPPAPTVIVRGGHKAQRILLAHDGSLHAMAAERAILTLPWAHDAEVRIVSVSDGTTDGVEIAAEAGSRLKGAVREVTTSVLRPDELQVFYRPRDIIMDAISSWHPDLLVLGSRGMSRWESVNEVALHRAGSTASALATHAPCSVLLACHRE